MDEKKKKTVYKWIKVAGLLSYLPFALAAGPLAGYFAAKYAEAHFNFPPITSGILITLGLLVSLIESSRIIFIAVKAEKG